MHRPDAWYDANLARCAAILAYLDDPTESNRDAMHDACATRQTTLFTVPPNAGVATCGQSELPDWRQAVNGAAESLG